MKAFPFTKKEWAALMAAALPLVDARKVEDRVLQDWHMAELLRVLARLRGRYGDHPILLETEADFLEDEAESIALYRRATEIAERHGLATLSIRLSLAPLLLDTGCSADALAELLACQSELIDGDESERAAWEELVAQARQADP